MARSASPSPIRRAALYDRIAAVKAVAGEVPVEGRIVFTRRGKFPKGLPKWTLMVDSLRVGVSARGARGFVEHRGAVRDGVEAA